MILQRATPSPNTAFMPPAGRALPSRKASRLRFAWFVLGSLFGAGLTWYVISTIHNDPEYSKRFKQEQVYALLESAFAPLPQQSSNMAVPAAPVQIKSSAPSDVNLSVQRGDTLMSMLMDKGIAHEEAYHVVESMKKVYNPKHLGIGQSLELHFDKTRNAASRPSITGLSIAVSPLTTIALSRSGDHFTTHEIKAPVYKETTHAGGIINSSLYQTGIDSGVPPQLLGEIINALSYDIDFQRDIKQGDALDMVYERMRTANNTTAGYGNVLYASLTHGDRDITLYHHISPDGYSGYYNAKGESVKKALLRTPINGAHITSSFGIRMHPLLGYSKMHKGIDFGAVTGTPIYAAGDGVIAEAGRKGTYGNYVRVKHTNTYETAYAHTSRFARGIHPGVHVKQGQVIAYVGSTGRSTGPHLHYEILVNGEQVNPSGVKFRTGQTLQGQEFTSFKREVKQVETALATLPRKSQLAALER